MGDEVLLRWNGQHMVLRYARATLSLRLLHVDSDRKVVDVLDFAQLPVRSEGLEPLPDGAQLVAAQEVESGDLGVCLPVLVFHAATSPCPSLSPQQKNLKRRRSDDTTDTSSTPLHRSSSLYFFALASAAPETGSTCALQFINCVDLPVQPSPAEATSSQEGIAGSSDAPSVHVSLVDGPHVVVLDATSEELAILRLRVQDARFYLWRSGVQLSRASASIASPSSQRTVRVLRSCVFVGSDASDEPHLLLHVSETTADGDSARASAWLVLRLADTTAALEPCAYVPACTESAAHATCCALLPRTAPIWSSKSDDDVLGLWQPGLLPSLSPRGAQTPVRVSPSTLVVTGTTQSTLEVHDCGVLLLSYVLPTPPSTIVQIDGGAERSFFLAVQCSDANRSFFLLSFNASALQPAMAVVQAFSHVGRALVGDFTAQSSADEILLVNDMSHGSAASDLGDAESHERVRDVVLVNKSVLICKKFAGDKHSIHRFRAAGAEASAPRAAKRSRDSRAKDAFAPLRYIERIKFGAAQRTSERLETRDSGEAAHAVSQRQLAHLTRSLTTRLQNGMGELDRLRLVVADKRDMVRHVNQFVVDAWWRAQLQHAESNSIDAMQLLPLRASVSTESPALQSAGPPQIAMETLVASADDAERMDVSLESAAPSYALTPLVTLESFRVVSFAPATAELRVEAVLRNASALSLYDACVSLVGASGTGSCDLQSSSSVHCAFRPESAQSFAVTVTLPPTFALLRTRASVCAIVWLHCTTRERRGVDAPRPCTTCSLQVGAVTIQPHDFVCSRPLSPEHGRQLWTPREVEKLLVLSSGSNLLRVLDASAHESSARVGPLAHLGALGAVRLELVRPTFALATLAIRERAESKYHVSELHARLPADVYTMPDPLQEAHVRDLAALLAAIRSEMVGMQQRSVRAPAEQADSRVDDESSSSNGAVTTQQQWQLLSAFRQQQHATDLAAAKLLQKLQTRANYHSMWHAL